MNERIKLLAEQADIVFGFDKNGDPEVICAAMDIEKFAELIILECAGIVKFTPTGVSHARIIEIIKEHFGVEE